MSLSEESLLQYYYIPYRKVIKPLIHRYALFDYIQVMCKMSYFYGDYGRHQGTHITNL